MHQHEQERCARDRRTATKLRDIASELHITRCLIQAAEMASNSLSQNERDPLVELLAMIESRLDAHAESIIAQSETSHQERTTDAA